MKTVLFACIHNAGRSQMAKAFFNKHADPLKARAISAGTSPASKVHPEVFSCMQEIGIDLSDVQPTLLTKELAETVSVMITMGCGERCPYIPGLKVFDWSLEDPKGQSAEKVLALRGKVEELVISLIKQNGWS